MNGNVDPNELNEIEQAIKTRLEAIEASMRCISMDVFTLACCYIDQIAGFYCGKSDFAAHPEYFKKFVDDFLVQCDSRYKSEELYKDLRCGLVHSAAPGKKMVFSHANDKGIHLAQVETDFNGTTERKILFKLNDFVGHLKKATDLYINELKRSKNLQLKAIRRKRKLGILRSGVRIQK